MFVTAVQIMNWDFLYIWQYTNILSPGLFFITLILLDSTLELTF